MPFCVKCLREMKCAKTGCITVFNEHYHVSGDEFACDGCGARIRIHAMGGISREESPSPETNPIFVPVEQ